MLWVKLNQQGFNTALSAAQNQQQTGLAGWSTIRSNGYGVNNKWLKVILIN
jgi:hypothetical protein